MTPEPPASIVGLVTHARQVPATERERFAAGLHRELAGTALIVETCHRVEAYVEGAADPDALALALSLPPGGRVLTGETVVRHALAMAVGRDSVVLGEDQILHQLRESVDAARVAGRLDPALERLFALALQAGRRARSWQPGRRRSLADVALAAIERQGGPIRRREILIVGAGRMGSLAARAAIAAGASVTVASRSPERSAALATATGSRTEDFDPGVGVARFAGVVVGLAGPWPIGPATIDALAGGTTVVVDLSVPAAVLPGAADALGPRLVTADALALDEADVPPAVGPGVDGLAARFDGLIEQAHAEFMTWSAGRDGRAAASALASHAEREREAELAALWQRLPDLDPEARQAIEGMTRHLTARLLRRPLERLGRDVDGREGRAVREVFGL